MRRTKRIHQGFTLIEVLVSVTIVAVLVAVGVVSYGNVNKRSRNARRYSDIEQIRSAMELYRADAGKYPQYATADNAWADVSGIPDLVPSGYMPAIPQDPSGSDPYLIRMTNKVGSDFFGYCIAGAVEAAVSAQCDTSALGAAYTYSLKNP